METRSRDDFEVAGSDLLRAVAQFDLDGRANERLRLENSQAMDVQAAGVPRLGRSAYESLTTT